MEFKLEYIFATLVLSAAVFLVIHLNKRSKEKKKGSSGYDIRDDTQGKKPREVSGD